MNRMARKTLLLLACTALLMKAAVPVGYMVGMVDGHLALTLCPAYAPVPTMHDASMSHDASMMHDTSMAHDPAMPMAGHVHHQHDAMSHSGLGHAGHAGAAHFGELCPFTSAHGAALQLATAVLAAPYYVGFAPVVSPPIKSVPAPPPWRHAAPRGPPLSI